jgi:ABC-2 type transport system permease protein
MNSFLILFWDEFRGFIKSKVMIALWVGLPVLALILHFIQPDTEGVPITIFTGLMISSLGGLLAAVMLSATMVNEMNAQVYDLYLIRPVKRWHILVTKYLAVFLSLGIASLLSLAVGLLVDYFTVGIPTAPMIGDVFESFAVSMASMSIACVAGILIGILVKSVALAAILSIYLGQQLSVAAILPGIFFEQINGLYFSLGIGIALTVIILVVEIIVFNKKQF